MNSVDAGSTFCNITLTDGSFSIKDDGKGFKDDQEIYDFFETFGTPHKEGDATYGKFRMGRGQMFSFGRNVWTTGNYRMEVDLKPQEDPQGNDYALGYLLEKTQKKVKGCKIEVDLYETLLPSRLDSAIREISKYLRYVNIPVRLNGKLISVDPANEKWDEITEDAYIKRKASGNLEIYNIGVLVKDGPTYTTGMAGTVVSKTQLRVNFARNDVQSDCPVWKRISKVLRDKSMDAANKATPLTEYERGFFAHQLASGEASFTELRDTRIITDVTGSHHPLKRLENVTDFSVASIGNRVAEMAHTRKLAFVLSDECVERFGISSGDEFKALMKKVTAADAGTKSYKTRFFAEHMVFVPPAEFSKFISNNHEPLKDTELNKAEMLALRAIRAGARALFEEGMLVDRRGVRGTETFVNMSTGLQRNDRRISAGVSDTANGWTDGRSDIWINRKILKKMRNGMGGFLQVSSLLLHEYIHREASTGTHDHGVEFYQAFHDYAIDSNVLQKSAAAMMSSMVRELRKDEKDIPRILAELEDTLARGSKVGLSGFESDPAPSEEELDAELIRQMQDVPDMPDVVMAASSEPVLAPRARRPRTEPEGQFKLSF